jgi:hypothetical protein
VPGGPLEKSSRLANAAPAVPHACTRHLVGALELSSFDLRVLER